MFSTTTCCNIAATALSRTCRDASSDRRRQTPPPSDIGQHRYHGQSPHNTCPFCGQSWIRWLGFEHQGECSGCQQGLDSCRHMFCAVEQQHQYNSKILSLSSSLSCGCLLGLSYLASKRGFLTPVHESVTDMSILLTNFGGKDFAPDKARATNDFFMPQRVFTSNRVV